MSYYHIYPQKFLSHPSHPTIWQVQAIWGFYIVINLDGIEELLLRQLVEIALVNVLLLRIISLTSRSMQHEQTNRVM